MVVRRYPSCGFWGGFMYVVVRDCSLIVVGVPVKIPVRALTAFSMEMATAVIRKTDLLII
jgi:hypothetical protein